MTILVDLEIEREVNEGRLIIDPFDVKRLQPNSYDVLLSSTFTWYESFAPIDPYDRESVDHGLVLLDHDYIDVLPGKFVLGATIEKFSLPRNIVGQITGKSSLARLGLAIHITAGFVDAGFSSPPASLTLEIVNHNSRPIRLYAGMPVAQMVFTRTSPCRVSYNEREGAKYNGQKYAAASEYFKNQRS